MGGNRDVFEPQYKQNKKQDMMQKSCRRIKQPMMTVQDNDLAKFRSLERHI